RSPDGSRIAFGSNHADDRWRVLGSDLYVLSVQQGEASELRCLTDGTSVSGSPSWSPDGQMLAFLSSAKRGSSGQIDLCTISVDASATAINLTEKCEFTCQDCTNSDVGD